VHTTFTPHTILGQSHTHLEHDLAAQVTDLVPRSRLLCVTDWLYFTQCPCSVCGARA
jgi:hypothetical protein